MPLDRIIGWIFVIGLFLGFAYLVARPLLLRRKIKHLINDVAKAAPDRLKIFLDKAARYQNRDAILTDLKKLKDPTAQNKLCQLAMEGHDLATQLTEEAGFVPTNPVERAVFYYKTQNWENLAQLDPDGKLLQQSYNNSLRELQAEFLANARASGRADLAKIVNRAKPDSAGQSRQADIEKLPVEQQWAELWQLVLDSSPEKGVQILQRLVTTGWQPTETAEQTTFLQLLDLSFGCQKIAGLGQLGQIVKRFSVTPPPLQIPKASTPTIALSPDARLLAVPLNNKIEIYAVETGQHLYTINIPFAPRPRYGYNSAKRGLPGSLAFSPDGEWLAYCQDVEWEVASDDSFDAPDIEMRRMLGKVNLSQPENATNRNWENYLGQDCYTFLTNHTLFTLYPADRNSYQYYGRNLRFGIDDLTNNKKLLAMDLPPITNISLVIASQDGQIIAGTTQDERVWLWHLIENKLSFIPTQIAVRRREEIQFSPDGKLIAFLYQTGLTVIDVAQNKVTRQLSKPGFENPTCLTFSRDSRIVAVAYSKPAAILLWDLEDSDSPIQLPIKNTTEIISSLCFPPIGDSLIAVKKSGEVQTWASYLTIICNRPPEQNTLQDLAWLQQVRTKTTGLSVEERAWLHYCEILLKWRWRHEILVDNWQEVTANQTDIEI